MVASGKVPSATKTWTAVKLYAALKDLPEVGILVGLVGATLGLGAIVLHREYFTTAGGQFPSVEMRHHWERQVSYGQERIKPSLLWRVAQWRKDPRDGSIDIGVWWSNKAYPHDHEQPYAGCVPPMVGVPAEGPSPTEY